MAAGAIAVTKRFIPPNRIGVATINVAHTGDYATGGIAIDLTQLRLNRADILSVSGFLYDATPKAYSVRLVKGASYAADKLMLFDGSAQVANLTTLAASGEVQVYFSRRVA
jgi:hypothetical protein